MAELWGRSAGVNRKLRELYARESGANRKLEQLWARDSGAVGRKIFGAGAQAGETVLWCETQYGSDNAWILDPSYQQIIQQPTGLTVHGKAKCWLNDSTESDAAYFGFTIPLDFGEQIPFHAGTSSSDKPVCLRITKSFDINFLNDEPDDDYRFQIPDTHLLLYVEQSQIEGPVSNSYSLDPVATSNDYVKTFQANSYTTIDYVNISETQIAYLKFNMHLSSDNGNRDDVLYCKFSILIPDGAIVVVDGNGKEYPVFF